MSFWDGGGWEEEELGDRFDGSTRDSVDNQQGRGSRGLENLLVILRSWMMMGGVAAPCPTEAYIHGRGRAGRCLLIIQFYCGRSRPG